MAVALMVNAKKGLSALQMKRDLKVAYKTAWYLNHRIRKAMGLVEAATDEPLTGTVEVDETYIGGKYDKRRKRARWDKEPVVGMVSRDGKAKTWHVQNHPSTAPRGGQDQGKHLDSSPTGVCTDDSNLYVGHEGAERNVQKHKNR